MTQEKREEDAYHAGYLYGVEHPELSEAHAKDLGIHLDDQTLRIEWDRGFDHCKANRMLGHDVRVLCDQRVYWLHDPATIVFELSARLAAAEARVRELETALARECDECECEINLRDSMDIYCGHCMDDVKAALAKERERRQREDVAHMRALGEMDEERVACETMVTKRSEEELGIQLAIKKPK